MSEASKKYILYCAQEGNFCTRSMLIPHDLIMKCEERVKDLQVLRDNASRNVMFKHRGREYVVDQLLVQNITWDNNIGRPDDNPYREIIGSFTSYADGMAEGYLSERYDSVWANDIICHVASEGFNDVVNYCNFRNKTQYRGTPIEIIEGFLVLESNNEEGPKMPVVDTVDEMFQRYYS